MCEKNNKASGPRQGNWEALRALALGLNELPAIDVQANTKDGRLVCPFCATRFTEVWELNAAKYSTHLMTPPGGRYAQVTLSQVWVRDGKPQVEYVESDPAPYDFGNSDFVTCIPCGHTWRIEDVEAPAPVEAPCLVPDDECPNCKCGTLEYDAGGGLICRGECGALIDPWGGYRG
jgi:uncharacterized Zn-finger protein